MLYRQMFKKPVPARAKRVTRKDGKTYAHWTNTQGRKMNAEIRVDAQGREYVNIESAKWSARYTDSAGRMVQRSTGCSDKSAAEAVLSQWKGKAEKVKAGFLRASDEHADRRGPVLIDRVLQEYRESLLQSGRTEKHVTYITHVVAALGESMRIARVVDITQRAVERYLHTLRDAGKGARTVNMHKALLHGFCAYCERHGYLERNPAAHIESANVAADRRHTRRALTDAEVAALLTAAAARPLQTFMRKNRGPVDLDKVYPETLSALERTGRQRCLIYKTLLTTAARWGELRAVTVADAVLEGDAPHLVLKATATKNRKADTVPLTRELAADLKFWIRDSGRIGKAPLFDMPESGLRVFDKDLAAAKIPKTTDEGVADVHALRHTAATRLARAGTPVAVAQRILRHSDPKLTMTLYSHLGVLDTVAAVEALPPLPVAEDAPAEEGAL